VRDVRDRPLHGDRTLGDLHQAERLVPALSRLLTCLILLLPKIAPWFFGRYGDRVIEPEIKLVFFTLFVLMVPHEDVRHPPVPAEEYV